MPGSSSGNRSWDARFSIAKGEPGAPRDVRPRRGLGTLTSSTATCCTAPQSGRSTPDGSRNGGLILFVQEDVGRFEVPMENAPLMRIMNGARNGLQISRRPARRQRSRTQPILKVPPVI